MVNWDKPLVLNVNPKIAVTVVHNEFGNRLIKWTNEGDVEPHYAFITADGDWVLGLHMFGERRSSVKVASFVINKPPKKDKRTFHFASYIYNNKAYMTLYYDSVSALSNELISLEDTYSNEGSIKNVEYHKIVKEFEVED